MEVTQVSSRGSSHRTGVAVIVAVHKAHRLRRPAFDKDKICHGKPTAQMCLPNYQKDRRLRKDETTRTFHFEPIPVIFANNEDIDNPGLLAAVNNEKVIFDGKTYQPGDSIEVVGRIILFVPPLNLQRPSNRKVTIANCIFKPTFTTLGGQS